MVIFVGKEDWIQQIIGISHDVTRQSLKNKGLHAPP
jgi:hypothetical protein